MFIFFLRYRCARANRARAFEKFVEVYMFLVQVCHKRQKLRQNKWVFLLSVD